MCSPPFKHTNLVFVISGPSGCGKSTVVNSLCDADDTLRLSISATTRTARPDEVDGVNYHFLTEHTFEEKIKQNAFLEWAKYHNNYYGTLKSEIEEAQQERKDTVLEIEVNGALHVKEQDLTPVISILIFLIPASYTSLEHRLRGRQTEAEEELKHRLEIAVSEIHQITHYDYCVVNHDGKLEHTVRHIQSIISAERSRVKPDQTSAFFQSFGIPDKVD